MKLRFALIPCLVICFYSCKKTSSNIVANESIAIVDSIEVPFSVEMPYTYYNFRESTIVPQKDSATDKWDIGFRFVNIVVNSHASGPGNAAAIVESGIYDDYNVAPEVGYGYDTSSTKLAINSKYNDPDSWYVYLPDHRLVPKAGKFFVIRTADSHFAKMEIISVTYKDYVSPDVPPKILIYKFRYTYQPDKSRNLNIN